MSCMEVNSESRLQANIVIRFSQKYPDRRGRLIGYFANSNTVGQTSQKLSLGLIKGCSDLLYVDDERRLMGVELKLKSTHHNRVHLIEQAIFLINIPYVGWFCDSEEMFFSIINGGSGIDPQIVLDNCLKLKTATVEWNKVKK